MNRSRDDRPRAPRVAPLVALCAFGVAVLALACGAPDGQPDAAAVDPGDASVEPEDAADATAEDARDAPERDAAPPDAAEPDGACTPEVTLVCCDGGVCLDRGCGATREAVADCPHGCEGGACLPCAPRCAERECGDDGCGGSCGACDGGAACVGGVCACLAGHRVGCCPVDHGGDPVATLCRFDSCGGVEATLAACPGGCAEDGACLGCAPSCAGRECGDDGCGGECGVAACPAGAQCVDGQCACVPTAAVACCAEGLCLVDSCGVIGAPVASCPGGCVDGVCAGCSPSCDGRACGPDGCGGSCGACVEPGESCSADGLCVCTPAAGVACCEGGAAVCPVDSCGAPGPSLAACAWGCENGVCLPCQPDCGGKVCGPDGCGGECGTAECDGGAECVSGQCQCVPTMASVCCDAEGPARCRLDSCGEPLEVLAACPHGCVDGACLGCAPACAGAVCGPDGCGGVCGACDGGQACVDGACVCAPAWATACCGSARCELDSCGQIVKVIEACPHGCAGDTCTSCVADCAGRVCGPDACGGSCGSCPADAVCTVGGACVTCAADCAGRVCGPDGCGGSCGACPDGIDCTGAGRCDARVTGRFLRERRAPNAGLTALSATEVVPAAGVPVLVTEGAVVRATVETDDDGRIDLLLDPPPTDPVAITLVASLVDAEGAPLVTLIDGAGVAFPTSAGVPIDATRVWAWSVDAADGLDLGELTITASQGAGALQLLAWMRDLRAATLALYGDTPPLPSLAVLWAPGASPPCLACFLPAEYGPVRLTADGAPAVDYGRAIWLSGTSATPYHWTPSMVGHEFGHYVMDTFSRSPDEGGPHAWDNLINPALAWSEGFATFFGQWWLSADAPVSRFFSMQSGTQYWIDIERIGAAPGSDDSSFASVTFPLPRNDCPLPQRLNEAVVAAILWDLWDETSQLDEPEAVELGDLLFDLLASERVLDPSLDRGYCKEGSGNLVCRTSPPPATLVGCKTDLVDLLDAIRCADALSEADLASALMGLPYDGALATCPPP